METCGACPRTPSWKTNSISTSGQCCRTKPVVTAQHTLAGGLVRSMDRRIRITQIIGFHFIAPLFKLENSKTLFHCKSNLRLFWRRFNTRYDEIIARYDMERGDHGMWCFVDSSNQIYIFSRQDGLQMIVVVVACMKNNVIAAIFAVDTWGAAAWPCTYYKFRSLVLPRSECETQGANKVRSSCSIGNLSQWIIISIQQHEYSSEVQASMRREARESSL